MDEKIGQLRLELQAQCERRLQRLKAELSALPATFTATSTSTSPASASAEVEEEEVMQEESGDEGEGAGAASPPSAAPSSGSKRVRLAGWAPAAELRLVELYRLEAPQLLPHASNQQIKELWRRFAEVLNEEFGQRYSRGQVRQKWKNLRAWMQRMQRRVEAAAQQQPQQRVPEADTDKYAQLQLVHSHSYRGQAVDVRTPPATATEPPDVAAAAAPSASTSSSSSSPSSYSSVLSLRLTHMPSHVGLSYSSGGGGGGGSGAGAGAGAAGGPLWLCRGEGSYLWDERGGPPYLDCVNNVAAAGHCHPRIVQAATAQLQRINTNTVRSALSGTRTADSHPPASPPPSSLTLAPPLPLSVGVSATCRAV